MLNFVGRIWELITRLARVIVQLDDFFIEAKAFWDWLTRKELIEPDK